MKLEDAARKRPTARNGRRFYTSLDMAIIKHDAAKQNAQEKRGELPEPRTNTHKISVCGCGREGCFIHSWRKD